MRTPLSTPADLPPDELATWRSIVSSVPGEHFEPSDAALLRAFCTANALHQQARRLLHDQGLTITDEFGIRRSNPAVRVLTRQAAAMCSLAQKLRLTDSRARETSKNRVNANVQ